MDKHGNLTEIEKTEIEKTKLGIFLLNFRTWWKDAETIELINSFEDFRREIKKDF